MKKQWIVILCIIGAITCCVLIYNNVQMIIERNKIKAAINESSKISTADNTAEVLSRYFSAAKNSNMNSSDVKGFAPSINTGTVLGFTPAGDTAAVTFTIPEKSTITTTGDIQTGGTVICTYDGAISQEYTW